MAQGHLESVGIHTVTIPQHDDRTNTTRSESPDHRARDMFRKRMGRSKTPPRAPGTPPRLSHSSDEDAISPRQTRPRINSRDYTHTYDNAYGSGNDDMIGVCVARSAGGWWEKHQSYLFLAYLLVLCLVGLVVAMAFAPADEALADRTLTVTNVVHFGVTLIYLHWMKGGCVEDQGELEHMTLWEQIEATPHTGWLRFGLRVVPILLCWCACTQANWEIYECTFNAIVLYLTLLGKFPFMNGVRLLGINAHPTINKGE